MEEATGDARTQTRVQLRRRLIAARESLSVADHAERSARIERHLEALLRQLAPRVIGFCWPFRGEFDARPLVLRAIAAGARSGLPVLAEKAAPMSFRRWDASSIMATDRLGIHYPVSGEVLVPELLLMPLVGFDARGYRLGYGGGYFDRTVAALAPRPVAVGVGFELARLADLRPADWDIPCDYVVTEDGTWQPRDGALVAVATS